MASFEKAPPEVRELLPSRIRDLGLRLEASPIAHLVARLYDELEAVGLHHFRPLCYLSDEWGCPSGEPVIGIPFYLGHPRVASVEASVNDVEGEREIMMYLRHEAGHAFNYAYELYRTEEWRALFGPFRRPYRDDFPFVPFSRDYVRHIGGWYAQKHPDDDFAETFAVWLDPHSEWRIRYAGWGAMRKLMYLDCVARTVGSQIPPRQFGRTDITVDEMEQTVEEFYRDAHVDESKLIATLALDADLMDIFVAPSRRDPQRTYRSAAELLHEQRREIVDKVYYWTGVRRTLVRALVVTIERRMSELGLLAADERALQQMIELTVYTTTLAMTFLTGNRRLRHPGPVGREGE
jgi:hypothetical protein